MDQAPQQPNFKGNIRDHEDYSTRSKSRKQKDLSPGKFNNSEKRRKKNRVEFSNIQNVSQHYQVPEEIEEAQYRLQQVQRDYAKMESVINTLFEKTTIPKFRSEEVDQLTETIITVEEQAKKLQERLNIPILQVKKLQAELTQKIASQIGAGNSLKNSIFGGGAESKPCADAQMQLKSLEDRLINLEHIMR